MPKIPAYILINVDVGKIASVFKQLIDVPQTTHVSVTAGEFDIIIRVMVNDLEELFQITEKIHEIEGILRTVTHVVEKEVTKGEV